MSVEKINLFIKCVAFLCVLVENKMQIVTDMLLEIDASLMYNTWPQLSLLMVSQQKNYPVFSAEHN